MLHLSSTVRYYLYQSPADMRKGFDSLSGIVASQMKCNATSGDIFIFLNRARTHVKLLLWEGDGFSLYYKRLEQVLTNCPFAAAPRVRYPSLHINYNSYFRGLNWQKSSIGNGIRKWTLVINIF